MLSGVRRTPVKGTARYHARRPDALLTGTVRRLHAGFRCQGARARVSAVAVPTLGAPEERRPPERPCEKPALGLELALD